MESADARAALVRSTLIAGILRVDLQVQDLERSLGFYRDVVGLQVASRDERRADLKSQEGPAVLRLEATAVSPADPRATGLFHAAIRFPTRSSLGDALARCIHAGIEIAAGDHLVSEALYVDDPDGNGVELYWDRPEEEWPAPRDEMMVPMATLAVDMQDLLASGGGRSAVAAPAPTGTDIGHVHLQVSDIERTTAFYSEVVGLDLVAKLGNSASFFSSRGYHHNIGANSWRSRGGTARRPGQAGLERVTFAVTHPTDMEALRQRVVGSGVAQGADPSTLLVHDPDGIELQFQLVS